MISRICSLLRVQQPNLVNRGLLWASGTTVPTAGSDGYQTGCIFQHTSSSTAKVTYINEGSVTSCTFRAIEAGDYGEWASLLHGSGIPISSSDTANFAAYSDDNNANIGCSCRGALSRFLLTTDQSGGSIRALMGQLKLADGVDVTTGIYTAVQGYVELAGDHSAQTGSTFSCFDASLEIASTKVLTVDSGGEACGIHVETTGAGTISNSGTCAGILVQNASGAPKWPVGIQVAGGSVLKALVIGSTSDGEGVILDTTTTRAVGVYCELESDAGSGYAVRTIRARLRVDTGGTTETETYGIQGQHCTYASNLGHWHAGVLGTLERSSGTVRIYNPLAGAAAVIGRVGGNITIDTAGWVAGVIALGLSTVTLTSGVYAGFYATKASGTDWSHGVYVEDCTTGVYVGGTPTTGVQVASAVQAFKAEYNVSSQLGAWVHGVKVELTRTADIQPATGGWFGAQFVLNAGSSGYSALNKGTYALQAVFKGSDTNPNGTDIHVARFETQSAGKVSDICYITANSGTTIVGSLLYLATHVAPGKAIVELNVQSSQTVAQGLSFMAGSGSTLTSLLYCSGDGTFTNFLEVAATGDGGVTVASISDLGATASGTIKVLVGSTPYYIVLYAAGDLTGE